MPKTLDDCIGELSPYMPAVHMFKDKKNARYEIELELPEFMGDYEGLARILLELGLGYKNITQIIDKSSPHPIGVRYSGGYIQSREGGFSFESKKVQHTTRKHLIFKEVTESEKLRVIYDQRGIKRENGPLPPRPGPDYKADIAQALLQYVLLYEEMKNKGKIE